MVRFRLQLVVVSSLLVGIPSTVGFRLSRSLWLTRSLFLETFSSLLKSRRWQSLSRTFLMMVFRLSQNLSQTFLSRKWNSGYQESFLELLSFTMEYQLSQSHSRTFLSLNGISAITEPFSNFSFSRYNFRRHLVWGKTLFIYIIESIYIGFAVVWTSLGPLPRWVPGPTTRWAPGTTRLALHGTWRRGAQGLHRSSTRLGSGTCSALYGGLLDVLD
jgi:hypothetical protein